MSANRKPRRGSHLSPKTYPRFPAVPKKTDMFVEKHSSKGLNEEAEILGDEPNGLVVEASAFAEIRQLGADESVHAAIVP